MCLSVPGQIETITGSEALVSVGGIKLNISLALVTDVNPGDYVLVHAGYALQKVDEDEACKTLELLRELDM